MPQRMTINVPLNRVEGDLEVRTEIEDGTVIDAWSTGSMYRGFENLLVGRGALGVEDLERLVVWGRVNRRYRAG